MFNVAKIQDAQDALSLNWKRRCQISPHSPRVKAFQRFFMHCLHSWGTAMNPNYAGPCGFRSANHQGLLHLFAPILAFSLWRFP